MAMNVNLYGESATETITLSDGTTKPAPEKIKVTGGATNVYGLARSGADLAAGATYNSTEVLGFYCEVAGGDWVMTFVGGGTVTFTPTAGTHYPYHLSSITSHASGTGVVFIPS